MISRHSQLLFNGQSGKGDLTKMEFEGGTVDQFSKNPLLHNVEFTGSKRGPERQLTGKVQMKADSNQWFGLTKNESILKHVKYFFFWKIYFKMEMQSYYKIIIGSNRKLDIFRFWIIFAKSKRKTGADLWLLGSLHSLYGQAKACLPLNSKWVFYYFKFYVNYELVHLLEECWEKGYSSAEHPPFNDVL